MSKRFFAFNTIFLLFLCHTVSGQSNLLNLLNSLMEKEQRIDFIQDSLATLQNKADSDTKNDIENRRSDLRTEQAVLSREILAIKSEIYEQEQPEPVWVEGEAEIVPDENKSFEENKRLALMFARRDAMEKGGKILIETLTSLKQFEVNAESGSGVESKYIEEYQSIIQSKGRAKVVDQDLSGDYGKVITVEEDGKNKLIARVRLRIVSMDDVNPFKNALENED